MGIISQKWQCDSMNPASGPTRKIIHIDMDCFYAAIEMRDNPKLANQPVAVGGPSEKRSVLCTCNYLAREYGVRSAMPTSTAYKLCPDLIVLPVNMPKYKSVSKEIQNIFKEYTDLVEPLALDEAYLDVTNNSLHQGSASKIAEEIRERIYKSQNLTASAGVAPNKFLAKIASGLNKPNGIYIIRPEQVKTFIQNLPVDKLFGVGKVTAEKMHELNLKTCNDLQQLTLSELTHYFGKFGEQLYHQCRGIDHRKVEPNRIRKSLSVERTFSEDIHNMEACLKILHELHQQLLNRIKDAAPNRLIKNQFVKIKFNDFTQTSAETLSPSTNMEQFLQLFHESYARLKKPIRLLGLGVNFHSDIENAAMLQQDLF